MVLDCWFLMLGHCSELHVHVYTFKRNDKYIVVLGSGDWQDKD